MSTVHQVASNKLKPNFPELGSNIVTLLANMVLILLFIYRPVIFMVNASAVRMISRGSNQCNISHHACVMGGSK